MNRANSLKCIHIVPRVYLYLALLLLTVPIQWVLAIISAVLMHELGHLAIIKALGAPINSIRIDVGGAVIESDFVNAFHEMLCAAGGPAFSAITIFLSRHYPELAFCAFSQTVFNLLPILPLDGGRVLMCVLSFLMPVDIAGKVMQYVGVSCLFLIIGVAIALTVKRIAGIVPLMVIVIAIRKYRHNKNSLQR